MTDYGLRAALKRLAASDTPLKRKNALKAFDLAVQGVLAAYPKLRKDGSSIVARKARGAFCPICNVPLRSYGQLVNHLFAKHRLYDRCFCGRTFPKRGALAKHLAAQKDLKVHHVLSQLKESADAHKH